MLAVEDTEEKLVQSAQKKAKPSKETNPSTPQKGKTVVTKVRESLLDFAQIN